MRLAECSHVQLLAPFLCLHLVHTLTHRILANNRSSARLYALHCDNAFLALVDAPVRVPRACATSLGTGNMRQVLGHSMKSTRSRARPRIRMPYLESFYCEPLQSRMRPSLLSVCAIQTHPRNVSSNYSFER